MAKLARVVIVGPLPPPAGGMANQTRKLAEFLRSEQLEVDIVQVNADYRPSWVAKLPVIRAVFRLFNYWFTLNQKLKNADVVHIMANSGWSWHLFAAPALIVAKRLNKPAILNYRGGYAEQFFSESWHWVKLTMKKASVIVVPSPFLQQVFSKFEHHAEIVPNVLDQSLFYHNADISLNEQAPTIIVTRNLEAIYDVATTIKAFSQIKQEFPKAQLKIAGTGPELNSLTELTEQLSLTDSVEFLGRLAPENMAALYQNAQLMLNASIVDNTPNSIIEALACGTPVISTDVGGIPKLVTDKHDALLVSPTDDKAMAKLAINVLSDKSLTLQLRDNGLVTISKFHWPQVWQKLKSCYVSALEQKENV
ncbi:MAG: glycosyltransferase family 4 protein [Pseudoalteromonas spongiae]